MAVTLTYYSHHVRYKEQEDYLSKALERAHHGEMAGSMSVESITTAGGTVLTEWEPYYKRHQEMESKGLARERARHVALFTDEGRPITWHEVSTLIRRMRWEPYLSTVRGITILMADKWGDHIRIASVAALRTMTPAQFWQRLRKLDANRAAQVERNLF